MKYSRDKSMTNDKPMIRDETMKDDPEILLKTEKLSKRFGNRWVLADIEMTLKRGDFYALMGPSGSGKTTLLRLLSMLEKPTAGKIFFQSADTDTSRRRRLEMRRKAAFILQKPAVFNMSVFDNVACGLKWRKTKPRKDMERAVSEMLANTDLAHLSKRNAKTLSGGEMQRVAIARALILEPRLLLMDEPTANLDPPSVIKIEELLEKNIAGKDVTVIMATHDFSQGRRLADKIGILMNGSLVQQGEVEGVFRSPRNKAAARFLGFRNFLDGTIVSTANGMSIMESGSHTIMIPGTRETGEKLSICFSPRDVTLAPPSPRASETTSESATCGTRQNNSFLGNILAVRRLNPLVYIDLDCGFTLKALIPERSFEQMHPNIGSKLTVFIESSDIRIIQER